MDDKLFWYRAKVLRVIDGETLKFHMDLGLGTFRIVTLPLFNIRTAEIRGVPKESEEYEKGMRAKVFVEERVLDKPVWVHTHKDKNGGRGRYTVEVFFQDDGGAHVSIGKLLLEEGLAEEI